MTTTKIDVYNAASTRVDIDTNEPYCNRAKLDTGTHCNYRCGFCYYKEKLSDVTDVSVIYRRIDYLVECGITEVDLSGGESSIHKNWFDILQYCTSRNLKISTLSNGYKFADRDFMKKSVDLGLREILFSVHGYDEDSHNQLVGNKHGFKRIVQAIENAHELGVLVRINCTVTHSNCESLPTKFTSLMSTLRPYELNFLTLNYWEDASEQQTIDYAVVAPYIKQTIDNVKEFIPIINVRYTPYCFMEGYERYVCNYYQHIYDIYDWNIAVYDYSVNPSVYKANPLMCLYDSAKRNRLATYYKPKECMKCKHYYICDGIEKQIQNISVYPSPGERITRVNFYRQGFYKHD